MSHGSRARSACGLATLLAVAALGCDWVGWAPYGIRAGWRLPFEESRDPVEDWSFAGTEEEAFALGVEVWQNASLSLQHLAEGRGFPYLHFLQPNQYVEGSKPFTEREERVFRRRDLLRELIPRWYPVLRERGAALRERGVRFHDLSGVYADVAGEIYTDDCCHVGREGNRIVAAAIGRIVADDYPGPDGAPD